MINKMEKELIFETLATLVTDIKDLRKKVERLEELNYNIKEEKEEEEDDFEYDIPFYVGDTVRVVRETSERIEFGHPLGTVGEVVDVSAYAIRIKANGMELWNDYVDLEKVYEKREENEEEEDIRVGDRVVIINSNSEAFGGHPKGTIGTVTKVDSPVVQVLKDGDKHGWWSSIRDVVRI